MICQIAIYVLYIVGGLAGIAVLFGCALYVLGAVATRWEL